jgi:hypothetical protein
MRAFGRPLGLFLALSLLLSMSIAAHAQALDYEYFDQTGHNVQGEFLRFYRQASNPLLLYGYPITEEFARSDGLRVQYFQRARFEYHPELPEGQRVVLTSLGTALYAPANPVNTYSPLACRYFEQTGYSVCYEFYEFFETNGGIPQFGLPISPFEYHDGTLVQYFEKTRLEWQPWREPGQRVVVTDLGRIFFDRAGEDPNLMPPSQPLNAVIQPAVLSLHVRAFVLKAVTLPNDQQTIYIIARDQRGLALADADCTTRLHWPEGRSDTVLSRTDHNGVATLPFAFNTPTQGELVLAEISCSYRNLSAGTATSFRIWY